MGKATREAYGNALARIGKENTNIIVLDADLSKSTKTDTFKAVCPERFFNVGIAEQNLISVGAGLAAAGKIPFVSSFSMFATGRAFEQIRNAVCYPKLNVKVCATHAGITVGEDGATHQSLEDISCMRTLPNMTVVVPADERETEAVIEWAASYNGPVYVRLGRAGVDDVTTEGYSFVPGKSTILVDGFDATIIACGALVGPAVEASKTLSESNISARVINMASIKPIDAEAIIKAAAETGAIVTAEEHNIIGGLGSAVSEVVASNKPVPMEFVGVQDTFGESGTPKELMAKYGLTANDIVEAVKGDPMIEFKNVSKVYDNGSVALDDVCLTINDGEFVLVCGHSGAGKSTLFKLLTHEVVPDAGTVIVDDFDVTHMKRSKIPKLRRKLGVVFQDFRLLPNKTVAENIAFALEVIEEKPKIIKEKVSHVLDLVGLSEKANDLPEDLSGGEQQRVAIARAIVNRPTVLIADEPTGNLDPDTSKDIVELFKHINNFGTTVIMVTHNMDLVSYLNKRVIRLKDGRVQSDNMRGAEINEA